MNIEDFKITVHLTNKGNMLARVELSIDYLRIVGYRVLSSEYADGLFIQPPSIRTQNGRYLWIAMIDEPNLWKQVETKIKMAYNAEKAKFDAETKDLDSDNTTVNPEDLPF